MGFKDFLISIIKSLIVLLFVTLIFSTIAFDVPTLVKDMFRDIFLYSSPEAQKEVVGKLTIACSSLDEKNNSVPQQEISKSPLQLNLSRIGALCKDYNSGKINDREFFFNVVGSAFPEEFELPKAKALEKYNSIINALNKNKIVYSPILAALLILLYLLIMDIKSFAIALTGISFSMGIVILLPYAAVILYDKFVGIDTTPMLATIFGGAFSLNIKSIISVVLLLVLRTYTSFIITTGAVFLGIGIAGKVYSWRLKKQIKPTAKTGEKSEKKTKEEKTNKEKPAKENEQKTKEGMEEAYKHRDRTTKEILDELEEIHKKRSKKD